MTIGRIITALLIGLGWWGGSAAPVHAQGDGVLGLGERLFGSSATPTTLTLGVNIPDGWLETLTIEHDPSISPHVQVFNAEGLPATMFDHHLTPTRWTAVYWLPFAPYTLQVTLKGDYVIGWGAGDQLAARRVGVGIGEAVEGYLPNGYGRAYTLDIAPGHPFSLALDSSGLATTTVMTPSGIVYRELASTLSPTQNRAAYMPMAEGAILSINNAGVYGLVVQGGIQTPAYRGQLVDSMSFEQASIEYTGVELVGLQGGQVAHIQIDYEHTYNSHPLASFNVYLFDRSGVEIYGEAVQEGADYWCGTFDLAANSTGPYYLAFLSEWGRYSLTLKVPTPQRSPDIQTPQNDGCLREAG